MIGKLLILFGGFIISGLVYAQDALTPVSGDELRNLVLALGNMKGISGLGIAGLFVQAVMMLMRSSFIKIDGKYKLLIVMGLSIVTGVFALKITGLDWISCLIHASTLGAIQVFLNQVYKQVFEKENIVLK